MFQSQCHRFHSIDSSLQVVCGIEESENALRWRPGFSFRSVSISRLNGDDGKSSQLHLRKQPPPPIALASSLLHHQLELSFLLRHCESERRQTLAVVKRSHLPSAPAAGFFLLLAHDENPPTQSPSQTRGHVLSLLGRASSHVGLLGFDS